MSTFRNFNLKTFFVGGDGLDFALRRVQDFRDSLSWVARRDLTVSYLPLSEFASANADCNAMRLGFIQGGAGGGCIK